MFCLNVKMQMLDLLHGYRCDIKRTSTASKMGTLHPLNKVQEKSPRVRKRERERKCQKIESLCFA